ncbi:PPOX class F420-dependent oxidoreductase [Candidatus Viridilinea mediisalina]|uniref:PPOX class F420-dependent enzyme n=1 Tax=Candidatus Viridilinea mediisalina TaxID=2024553 RepID=A0A2A6RP54_9CHLR|nr:PPOX class F420-dependent oxidoreductase [Candidatus Viridilinea mediisalina]PDW04715.1 PPOX class F420-dependent enzyme [Candidatus Viridilinea mediisalina]
MSQATSDAPFSILHNQSYANLFTFRKNGEAVKTPMWFAEKDGRIYIMTVEDSGKVKRIRNNPRVQLGASDRTGKPLGPTVDGKARLLTDPQDVLVAKHALDDKYGLLKAILDFFATVFFDMQRAWIEVEPA